MKSCKHWFPSLGCVQYHEIGSKRRECLKFHVEVSWLQMYCMTPKLMVDGRQALVFHGINAAVNKSEPALV
jgi:hypothetical protein